MAKKNKKNAFIYGSIAMLLLLSLLGMPNGFYVLVRYMAMIIFAYLAYEESKRKNGKGRMILFIVLALLFQPFIRLPFGITLLRMVDVALIILLFALLFKSLSSRN